MPEPQAALVSVLTCPACGHAKAETMPTNACLFFYDCTACGRLIRPLPGHCCVFCSYGSIPCPPVQQSGKNPPACGASGGTAQDD